jgi:hypothetical protein
VSEHTHDCGTCNVTWTCRLHPKQLASDECPLRPECDGCYDERMRTNPGRNLKPCGICQRHGLMHQHPCTLCGWDDHMIWPKTAQEVAS